MTNIGCGARPARTSSASRIVSRTWLSSTARRWALKSSPSCGTLPCTAATVTDGRRRRRHRNAGPRARSAAVATARGRCTHRAARPRAAPSRVGLRSSPRRHQSTISNAIAARPNPTSVTANDTSGAPPICASGSSGPSVWPKPTTPQGNPPNGTVDLSHSGQRPQSGEPQRPPGQPAHHARRAGRTAPGNSASSSDERQPRQQADQTADPRQQRQVERQPEQEAVAESAASVVDSRGQHPGQQRERDERRIPPAERREAQAQQPARRDDGATLSVPGHHRVAEPLDPCGHFPLGGRAVDVGGNRDGVGPDTGPVVVGGTVD